MPPPPPPPPTGTSEERGGGKKRGGGREGKDEEKKEEEEKVTRKRSDMEKDADDEVEDERKKKAETMSNENDDDNNSTMEIINNNSPDKNESSRKNYPISRQGSKAIQSHLNPSSSNEDDNYYAFKETKDERNDRVVMASLQGALTHLAVPLVQRHRGRDSSSSPSVTRGSTAASTRTRSSRDELIPTPNAPVADSDDLEAEESEVVEPVIAIVREKRYDSPTSGSTATGSSYDSHHHHYYYD